MKGEELPSPQFLEDKPVALSTKGEDMALGGLNCIERYYGCGGERNRTTVVSSLELRCCPPKMENKAPVRSMSDLAPHFSADLKRSPAQPHITQKNHSLDEMDM